MTRSAAPVYLAVFAIVLVSCASPELEVVQGNYRYRQGDYAESTIHYLRALERRRHPGFLFYNLGNVYYSLGETEPAIDTLVRASVSEENEELRFRASFNLGNVFYELGEYDKAVAHYIQALRATATDIDAKINLELALKKAESAASERNVPSPAEASASPRSELRGSHQRMLGLIRRKEEENWRMRPGSTAEQHAERPAERQQQDW
jgi:tetratricopeptide (TPR) repeat protein